MTDAIYVVASGTQPCDHIACFDCVHKASDRLAQERASRPHLPYYIWTMTAADLERYLADRWKAIADATKKQSDRSE